MDYKQFMKLMEPGESSGKDSINSLQEFVNEFPYFQSAQILLAKSMHEQQHVRYERQLKLAAAYAGDRKILYNLIHSTGEKFIEVKSIIREPEVISAPVEKTIEPENIFRREEENFIVPPYDDETESISSVEINTEPISPAIFYREPVEIIESETEEVKEIEVADPHDIIRKRLNEILGLKNEEATKTVYPLSDSKKETSLIIDEPAIEEEKNIVDRVQIETQKISDEVTKPRDVIELLLPNREP